MRDPDRYDKVQTVRRSERAKEGVGTSDMAGTITRILFLCVVLAGIGFGAWYAHRPVDTLTTRYDLDKARQQRDILASDAEKAREQLDETEPDEQQIALNLVTRKLDDPYFPLLKHHRNLIRKHWSYITSGSTNRDINSLMGHLGMCYAADGTIIDAPEDEEGEEAAPVEVPIAPANEPEPETQPESQPEDDAPAEADTEEAVKAMGDMARTDARKTKTALQKEQEEKLRREMERRNRREVRVVVKDAVTSIVEGKDLEPVEEEDEEEVLDDEVVEEEPTP